MKTEKVIEEIKRNGFITERQINLLKNRANRGEIIDFYDIEYSNITPEQTEKGIKFLLNLYKTPTGKVRKNNPFSDKQAKVLETFVEFAFVGFYPKSNGYVSYHFPIYSVCGTDGDFEYYYDLWNGTINII